MFSHALCQTNWVVCEDQRHSWGLPSPSIWELRSIRRSSSASSSSARLTRSWHTSEDLIWPDSQTWYDHIFLPLLLNCGESPRDLLLPPRFQDFWWFLPDPFCWSILFCAIFNGWGCEVWWTCQPSSRSFLRFGFIDNTCLLLFLAWVRERTEVKRVGYQADYTQLLQNMARSLASANEDFICLKEHIQGAHFLSARSFFLLSWFVLFWCILWLCGPGLRLPQTQKAPPTSLRAFWRREQSRHKISSHLYSGTSLIIKTLCDLEQLVQQWHKSVWLDRFGRKHVSLLLIDHLTLGQATEPRARMVCHSSTSIRCGLGKGEAVGSQGFPREKWQVRFSFDCSRLWKSSWTRTVYKKQLPFCLTLWRCDHAEDLAVQYLYRFTPML